MREIILSSSSKARLALMKRLNIPFHHTTPDVDETPLPNESAEALVARLAIEKAQKSASAYPNAIIIGADQVGTLDHHILCKPMDFATARKQLRQVSNRMVRFYTGMCVYDAVTLQQQCITEIYDVYFRELSDETINAYLHKEEPLHCAGSFQAEGLGIALIEKFAGNDFTALIGLPLIQLTQMLERVGVAVL